MAKNKNSKVDKLKKKLGTVKAKDIMTEDVVTTKEDVTLADAARLMIENRVSGLPVMGRKGNVVGVITMTDLFIVMDMIESGEVFEDGKVGSFNPTVKFAMSTEIVRIKKNTTLNDIIGSIKYKNLHTLPVFEGNKLAGVIGRRDVFKEFYSTVREIY